MKILNTILAVSLLTLCLVSVGLAQATYTITDLGDLGGGFSLALGINKTGQITGETSLTVGGSTHAFLYSNGTMTDLGVGPLNGRSFGRAINDSGQVAGIVDDGCCVTHAFLYSGGTITDLGTWVAL